MSQPTTKAIAPEEVIEAIRTVKYGSVLVKVQDGKIVEIEVTEKRKSY